jgi:hypothetical protein
MGSKEPVPAVGVGGVAQLAETLVKSVAGNGQRLSSTASWCLALCWGGCGVWRGGVGAAGGGVQTSCWVLREQVCVVRAGWFGVRGFGSSGSVRPGYQTALVVGVWWRWGSGLAVV